MHLHEAPVAGCDDCEKTDGVDCIALHVTLIDGLPLVPWDHWGKGCPRGYDEEVE